MRAALGPESARRAGAGRVAVAVARLVICSCCLVGRFYAGPVPEGEARNGEGAEDPRLAAILRAFDEAQAKTSTLVAGFTEEKEIRLLAQPVVARGRFYFGRPNQVRWEYETPDRKEYVITEDKYVAYFPALGKAEEVPFSRFVGKRLFRFLGLGQSIAELGKYYDLSLAPRSDLEGTHLLVLTARKRKVQERVREMRIWVDAASSLPRRIQYEETGGDVTRVTFHDLRPNAPLGSSTFRIALPRDVVVSKAFEGLALGGRGF
jgi:outer membrane lipoprotein-sorting protein